MLILARIQRRHLRLIQLSRIHLVMLRKVLALRLILAAQIVLAWGATARAAHTYVLHLNGIGGERSIDRMLVQGLAQGGVDADYHIYDWTEDKAGMLALSDVKLHETESTKVAAMIRDYRHAHPDDQIILTTHSAGAGIAAWALARLPEDVSIDTWVMLAPALSPTFDLSAALSHVKGKAYAFNSMNDIIVLGAGTKLMGTVDRVKTDAAGRVGFTRPSTASAEEYLKLINVPYDSAWMQFDNFGDHIGALMRPFAKHVIAPTLLDGVVPKFPPLVPTTEATTPP